MKLVNDTIERFKKQKLINEKVAEGLKRNDPKTGTKVELITFIKELNEKHKTIKFDFQIHQEKLHFLTQC